MSLTAKVIRYSEERNSCFDILNRRYTGSKAKLVNWIMELISTHCTGDSFSDIFAGTGIIAKSALSSFNKVIINDILFSNNIIYNAFFEQLPFDKNKIGLYYNNYSSIDRKTLKDNYISENFGNKFFSHNDAKIIGFIRENIEENKNNLNKKEYAILIASLLYSLDKSANTVGHFDAYFKNKDLVDNFSFNLIQPIITNTSIEIYRKDANMLAEEINSDIVYIDPPYNSRQYSRFYHVLENITNWKKPELHGVALKPTPENMSDYCRNNAPEIFDDLISKLKCKYIVVSYNNTYNSKSSSSRNKIEHEFIKNTLEKRGNVRIFEKEHKHFNAGKTEFNNHKEYLFITQVV